jgi:hypothetical protein
MTNGAVNLGTVALARQDTLITNWRVGSLLDSAKPLAKIPSALEALIARERFCVQIRSFAAAAFSGAFVQVLQENDRSGSLFASEG